MGINYLRIGERIRSLRELRGMTAAQLADKTNFTTKSVLLSENGKASLSLEFLLAICTALGVTPNDILRGEYPEAPFVPSEREALLDQLLLLLTGGEGKEKSLTKINDTDKTVKEIETMVTSMKQEQKKEEPTGRGNSDRGKWRPTYFR